MADAVVAGAGEAGAVVSGAVVAGAVMAGAASGALADDEPDDSDAGAVDGLGEAGEADEVPDVGELESGEPKRATPTASAGSMSCHPGWIRSGCSRAAPLG